MRLIKPLALIGLTFLNAITLVTATLDPPNALELTITTNLTHAIPSTIFGYMWEDINHSGDGGLYAELLQNRAFQGVIPGTQASLNSWIPINGAALTVTNKTPGVSKSLPNSLEVTIPKTISGQGSGVGFANTGFWGIKVQAGWVYNVSFWVKSSGGKFNGDMEVSLVSQTSGKVFINHTITSPPTSSWRKVSFTMTPSESAADENNLFQILLRPSSSSASIGGTTLHFGLLSLFPPTFLNRPNGMRIDLAEALAGTKPGVWRFPGGNNLEGHSFDARWRWNQTLGPLEDRPGRIGDWGYANTDGLGLVEYLQWAEDIGAQPILGVWAGISIRNYSDLPDWPVVPEADLQPYVDDVLDELDFILGDSSTKGGQLRMKVTGRKEGWALRFVEIGNEDSFQADSYASYRWNAFVSAIGAKYPQLEFLATTLPSTTLTPAYKKIDFHQYNSATWFKANAFFFDTYPRNGTQWFVGEYAVTSTNDSNALPDIPNGRLAFPTLAGSAAEAAFMTGMERNSDVVFASAYAPSFQHINSYAWTPDIITYNAVSMVKSTSYYVQEMFSTNKGTHVLTTDPTPSNDTVPLFWSASWNNDTGVVFLKVSNTGTSDLTANIHLSFNLSQNLYTQTQISTPALSPISGMFNTSNTLEEPNLIIPVHQSFAIPDNDKVNITFPAMSVSVISFMTDVNMTMG